MVAELQKRLTPERGVQLHTGCTLVHSNRCRRASLEPDGRGRSASPLRRRQHRDRQRGGPRAAATAARQARPRAVAPRHQRGRRHSAAQGVLHRRPAVVGGQPPVEPVRRRSADARDLLLEEQGQEQRRADGLHRPPGAAVLDRLPGCAGSRPARTARRRPTTAEASGTLGRRKAANWLLGEDGARVGRALPNRRLWQRFVQYASDYEHNDFTADRLHRVRHARLGQGTVRRGGARLAAAPEVVGGACRA